MAVELEHAIGALLDFRLAEWPGLPPCMTSDIARIYGTAAVDQVHLGAYPAVREEYRGLAAPAGGLIVYSRALRVIAVEPATPPPLEAAQPLGPPDVRKPGEIFLSGHSVREHLYLQRGLVLSVVEALDPAAEPHLRIARCRGIRILDVPSDYGADYYLALQSRVVFD